MRDYTKHFSEIDLSSIDSVGGKNASLGELYNNLREMGINVPEGFVTTSFAYDEFLNANDLKIKIEEILKDLDYKAFSNLRETGFKIRKLILEAGLSNELKDAIKSGYLKLCHDYGKNIPVAVRSSATAEDLPDASFAGQLESYLNIQGEEQLYEACLNCYASLYTDRGIKYRMDKGYSEKKISVSVGFQIMVRSDLACSGVAFTLEPDTGFKDVVVINGCWGLGENIVQGKIIPDEFMVFKPALTNGFNSIINKKTGSKEKMMIYSDIRGRSFKETTKDIDTPLELRKKQVLSDDEIIMLSKWCMKIEDHYGKPMDIEWAKDGISEKLYIVQARPETVHSGTKQIYQIHNYVLKEKSAVLATGISLGDKIAGGKARVLKSPDESDKLKEGEVLVTEITNPDWDPIMKKASAIVTDNGGRTSHAAIVARELGIVAVVGTGNATSVINDGQEITVSCAEGKKGLIYDGLLNWDEKIIQIENLQMPRTKVMLILADPGKAFKYSLLPNNGIGLMRLEFIISNSVKAHPLALINFDKVTDVDIRKQIDDLTYGYVTKSDYFVDTLAQGVATIAAAFYPKEVIVRMSDFKSNEYAGLLGGKQFEPLEENPMIGLRGAMRYYSKQYADGFILECKAMKKVRNEMGLTNIKLMIPFCRSVGEGINVLEIMKSQGLQQGKDGLEVYMMTEIPSNVILAEKFAQIFDGFSIGSNDLTQLTLGLDRDSALVSKAFNEEDESVMKLISMAIRSTKDSGKKIGICGQAASDIPSYAAFLVNEGIDSISFNPDAILNGIKNIVESENDLKNFRSPKKSAIAGHDNNQFPE